MQTQSTAASVKIYSGSSKCPRTVAVNILGAFIPTDDYHLFIHSDKQILDEAESFQDGNEVEFTEGIELSNVTGKSRRIVLQDVKKDIFARALVGDGSGNVITTEVVNFSVVAF